jgi:hypothetical protein
LCNCASSRLSFPCSLPSFPCLITHWQTSQSCPSDSYRQPSDHVLSPFFQLPGGDSGSWREGSGAKCWVCLFPFLRARMIANFNHPLSSMQTMEWTKLKTTLQSVRLDLSFQVVSMRQLAAATCTYRLWRVGQRRLLEGWIGWWGCRYRSDGKAGQRGLFFDCFCLG